MARPRSDEPLKVFATNRAARHNYHIDERLECGLVLIGPEVKSVREGKVVIKDAFATIKDGEVMVHNMHITPYAYATAMKLDPERSRKLLLHRREILKLERQIKQQGVTLVPLRLYLKNGVVKCEIGVARGKKQHDKRAAKKADAVRKEMRDAIGRSRKGL